VEFRRQAERFVSGAPAHRLPCLFCQNETIAGRHAFVSPIGGATIADGGGKPGRDIIPPPETDRSTIAKRVTAADVAALEADLDGVDRAIHSLAVPMRYSDVYFSVKSHLDLVRTRIGSRRAEVAARS
jgi:hypothetical protein